MGYSECCAWCFVGSPWETRQQTKRSHENNRGGSHRVSEISSGLSLISMILRTPKQPPQRCRAREKFCEETEELSSREKTLRSSLLCLWKLFRSKTFFSSLRKEMESLRKDVYATQMDIPRDSQSDINNSSPRTMIACCFQTYIGLGSLWDKVYNQWSHHIRQTKRLPLPQKKLSCCLNERALIH